MVSIVPAESYRPSLKQTLPRVKVGPFCLFPKCLANGCRGHQAGDLREVPGRKPLILATDLDAHTGAFGGPIACFSRYDLQLLFTQPGAGRYRAPEEGVR